jgi:MscS family membrane protein
MRNPSVVDYATAAVRAGIPMTRQKVGLTLSLFPLLAFLVAGPSAQTPHVSRPSPARHAQTLKPAPTPTESTKPEETPPEIEAPRVDPLGRSTPYGCVIGFLQAVSSNKLPVAVQYLDTKLSEAQAEVLAQQLKAVLDSGLSSSVSRLSRESQGNVHDDLRETRENVGTAKTQDGDLEIFLDRVKRPDEPAIWLFSSDTLSKIPRAYSHLQRSEASRLFPAPLVHTTVFGLPLWRWISILAAILLALILSSIVTRLLLLAFRLLLSRGHFQNEERILRQLNQPVRVLLLSLAAWGVETVSVSALGRTYWTTAARILGTLGCGWLFARLFDLIADAAAQRSLAAGTTERLAVITLARRLFKILVLLAVVLLLLSGAGVKVTEMLAGLGIGGIALALAAQKTLEDLFGGISIITRESIRVGDYCRVADQLGTIEDIGLSATRLRTRDRTVVSIPNAKIAQLSSENFALRDKFWFHHILSLRYDTSDIQIEQIVRNVTAALNQASEIEMTTYRVNLIGLNQGSFQLEIFAYIKSHTYETFLVVQERLLLNILAAVSVSGGQLAPPPQAIYVKVKSNDDNHSATEFKVGP